jgi:3D-(3,5/4)-trihydroxycyclohexane-1,2-dione acylhydrolase (decyclizing)
VALADPGREVYVMVGDGSFLMMSSEIVTAVQEGVAFTVVLVDNHGFGSIGNLSTALGSDGFGTRYRQRTGEGEPGGTGGFDGPHVELDLVAMAAGMGARAVRAQSVGELEQLLAGAREEQSRPTVIVVECDPALRPVPGYDAWWEVPVAEVSEMPAVQAARAEYETQRARRPLSPA